MDQPKIERLLRLMKMLTANRSYRVDELAERLLMSRRTIYRYIDTFREAGFVIKRDGDYIRLDKESPHFKDISQLVHFTDEEALILRRAIESIDDTNMLKVDLKRKLYSVYDNGTISLGRLSGQRSNNIHTLLEAIGGRERVVLKRYQSAHGSVVRDRMLSLLPSRRDMFRCGATTWRMGAISSSRVRVLARLRLRVRGGVMRRSIREALSIYLG